MTRESERERARETEIERAMLQSSHWVGVKKSIVEHKVSLMQPPHPTHMHVHTYTHTWLRRERYKHGREIDLYIYKEGIMDFCSEGGRNSTLSTTKKKKDFHKRYKVITDI